MGYCVYKTTTVINDHSLLRGTVDETLHALFPYIFKPNNILKYMEICNSYVVNGTQKAFKRYLASHLLVTERVFVSEEIAQECKTQLDVIYEDNKSIQNHPEKFEFIYQIYNITDKEAKNLYNL